MSLEEVTTRAPSALNAAAVTVSEWPRRRTIFSPLSASQMPAVRSLEAVRKRYEHSYENIAVDLAQAEDIRVLDFNGHQIMANFSLSELGEPIKFGG